MNEIFNKKPNQAKKIEDAQSQDIEAGEMVARDKVKEVFFKQFIETGLDLELFQEIEDAGFSKEEILVLRQLFSGLTEQEKEYAFSFPYELRKKNFSYQYKSIKSGKKNLEDFWKPIVENGIKFGRALGYHCSLSEILPQKKKDSTGNEIESWEITGKEIDHRNNDLPMAYYSEDYMHLYRTKAANYLYVISSQRASGSGHHTDNSNKWGRASFLSVVQKFNLREVDAFVDDRVKEYFEEKKHEQAVA